MVVAPGTVLRGAGAGLVSIYFKEDNAKTAPPAYVTSSAPGAGGLEGVTMYVRVAGTGAGKVAVMAAVVMVFQHR